MSTSHVGNKAVGVGDGVAMVVVDPGASVLGTNTQHNEPSAVHVVGRLRHCHPSGHVHVAQPPPSKSEHVLPWSWPPRNRSVARTLFRKLSAAASSLTVPNSAASAHVMAVATSRPNKVSTTATATLVWTRLTIILLLPLDLPCS